MKNKGNKKSSSTNILLEQAFKQMHAPLFFYALKFIDREDVAKDLVQDSFLNILYSNSNSEIENLKAYLFRSVRNNCLNYIKQTELQTKYAHYEQERATREIEFYDTHQTLVEKELQQKLNQAIEELPQHYKIPFKLSRFEDFKNKEIAEQLELPVRTIETQIHRALKILRKKLKGQIISLFTLTFSKK